MPKDVGDMQDAELVGGARAGGRDAFDELTRRYFPVVYTIGMARLRDRDRAEDLTQEVFLHAWLLLDRLQKPELFSHWLTRMARNLAIDWLRRGASAARLLPMVTLEDNMADLHDTKHVNAREASASAEQARALQHVLDDLKPDQFEVVLLHYAHGMSHREIAEKLGVNQSTVSRHLDRTLRGMRDQMDATLRDMARGLLPRSNSQARALAVVPVVLGLSAVSRTALAQAASGNVSLAGAGSSKLGGIAAVVLHPQSLLTAAKSGGVVMASSKTVVPVLAVAVIGGAYFYKQNDQPVPVSPPSVITTLVSKEPARLQYGLPAGRRVVLRTERESSSKTTVSPSLQKVIPATMPAVGGKEVQEIAITTREVKPTGERRLEVETLLSNWTTNEDPFELIAGNPGATKSKASGKLVTKPFMEAFLGRRIFADLAANGQVASFESIADGVRDVNKGRKSEDALNAGTSFEDHFRRVVAPINFPATASVNVGDIWLGEDRIEMPMAGIITVQLTNRFLGWKLLDGRKVAEIQTDSKLKPGSASSPVPNGTTSKVTQRLGNYESTATYYYDPSLGLVGNATSKSTVEVVTEMAGSPKLPAGGSVKTSITSTLTRKIAEDSGAPGVAMR